MERLRDNWVTEGVIDFEYKKYILLAYLKHVRGHFDNRMLYPFLSDLIRHYRNLRRIVDEKADLQSRFPKVAEKADFKKLQISYKMILEDSDLMREIEAIVLYALDTIGQSLRMGREIYDDIEQRIEIEPVGLAALDERRGYFFLTEGNRSEVWIYRYELLQFSQGDTPYKGIAVEYLDQSQRSLSNTFEKIKIEVVKKDARWSSPAAYLIRSHSELPKESTLLPIAKRLLLRHLNAA